MMESVFHSLHNEGVGAEIKHIPLIKDVKRLAIVTANNALEPTKQQVNGCLVPSFILTSIVKSESHLARQWASSVPIRTMVTFQ